MNSRAAGFRFWLPVLLFLLLSQAGSAQPVEPTDSRPSLTSTEQSLNSLLSNLRKLKELLLERKIELQQAEAQLRELQAELTNLRILLAESEQEIATLTESLQLSRETSSLLQSRFDEYQQASERRVLGWQIATGLTALSALLLLIFL